jgi:hypothetical protein
VERNETSFIDNSLKHETEAGEETTDNSNEAIGLADADGAHLDGCRAGASGLGATAAPAIIIATSTTEGIEASGLCGAASSTAGTACC